MEEVEDDKKDVKKVFPFHEMGLDDRILKAIAKLGWVEPTLIQERAVPLVLEGKDLLARGRTGSGKTGAFCVPLVQRILEVKAGDTQAKQVRLLVRR
jgi:ATP-dependent RNA helicase DDX56/DBP9